ncbi:MAG: ATP-dependent protease ATPase subunit HslU [Rickettsiales bacterium]
MPSAAKISLEEMAPKNIVAELDRYIVGQTQAKKKVAIALRNRWRRRRVDSPMREEIVPKNILMIGSTGVGKTEIARRVARLSSSPFLKVEATKFTEVGYVGRDVDSIIRDLTDVAMNVVKKEHKETVSEKAARAAEEALLNALVGENAGGDTREKFRQKLKDGLLEEKEVELELEDNAPPGGFSSMDIPGMPGSQVGVLNIGEMISKAMGGNATKKRRVTVEKGRKLLQSEEEDKLLDQEKIVAEALDRVQQDGIVFIDEIDKIATRGGAGHSSGEVSREGVQRDLLPLLEGASVKTQYGMVQTDHILFIASGAFHLASPSDLLPELQGRLPIRVELSPLTEDDLVRILQEPECSLTQQYSALMATEGVTVRFTEDGLRRIASIAAEVNKNVENIGARRLQTVMENLLEDVSYGADAMRGADITVDASYVENNLGEMARNSDLSKFIL